MIASWRMWGGNLVLDTSASCFLKENASLLNILDIRAYALRVLSLVLFSHSSNSLSPGLVSLAPVDLIIIYVPVTLRSV